VIGPSTISGVVVPGIVEIMLAASWFCRSRGPGYDGSVGFYRPGRFVENARLTFQQVEALQSAQHRRKRHET
jgi:hypothetical protein